MGGFNNQIIFKDIQELNLCKIYIIIFLQSNLNFLEKLE